MRALINILLAVTILGLYLIFNQHIKREEGVPVSVIGVHHLGSDYYVDRFYVDKYYEGNVSQGGGGDGMVCCRILPRRWHAGLKVDIRWKVDHIIRSSIPGAPEKAELVGNYRAQVPVEAYSDSDDLYVHFFPGGRVRVVVSGFSATGKGHPIQWQDPQAIKKATIGATVNRLFSAEEIAEFEREIAHDRAKYGDWR